MIQRATARQVVLFYLAPMLDMRQDKIPEDLELDSLIVFEVGGRANVITGAIIHSEKPMTVRELIDAVEQNGDDTCVAEWRRRKGQQP